MPRSHALFLFFPFSFFPFLLLLSFGIRLGRDEEWERLHEFPTSCATLYATHKTTLGSSQKKGHIMSSFVPRDQRLECLSENHRRAMDYIDAVCYSDSTNSNILQDEVGKPNSPVRSAQLSHTDPRRTLAAPQRNQM